MDKRSPLRHRPLRAPGQSLEDRQLDLMLDDLLFPALAALMMVALWLYEAWRSYSSAPPRPVLSGFIALVAVAYAAWKWRHGFRQATRLRLALEGERSVGQGLERLRAKGYIVLHDIVGGDFNIDHVIIGPAGVFTIETKTMSKPHRGNPKITFDGQAITIDGRPALRDPIPQVRAQARWISEFLVRSTRQQFEVRPVVVYPGWFVESTGKASDNLWVLNDKALRGFLAREPERMKAADIALAAEALETFVRVRAEANAG